MLAVLTASLRFHPAPHRADLVEHNEPVGHGLRGSYRSSHRVVRSPQP
jgi:hypothetical protein